jgi:hypothetical protein
MDDVRVNCLGTNMHTCSSFTCHKPPPRYEGCRFNYPSATQYEGSRFNYPSAELGRKIRLDNLDLVIIDECSTMTPAQMHIIDNLARQRRHQDSIVRIPKIAKATGIQQLRALSNHELSTTTYARYPRDSTHSNNPTSH